MTASTGISSSLFTPFGQIFFMYFFLFDTFSSQIYNLICILLRLNSNSLDDLFRLKNKAQQLNRMLFLKQGLSLYNECMFNMYDLLTLTMLSCFMFYLLLAEVRATFRFSFVASWRATAKRSGLDLVRATARMAVSASSKAVANNSGLDWVRATVRSLSSAYKK